MRGGRSRYRVALICLAASLVFPAAGHGGGPIEEKRKLELTAVELADEPRERRRGLMFREELCPTCGMLFVHDRPEILSFWMKDTPLSLDMIFMERSGLIVTIHERTAPGRRSPLYVSSSPAVFVLEVNAGFSTRHGLEVGQTVDLIHLGNRTIQYRGSGQDP